MRTVSFAILLFVAASSVSAAAPEIYPRRAFSPGDTVVAVFREKDLTISSATFDGAPVAFFPYRSSSLAVFGIPATKRSGKYPLRVAFTNGETFAQDVMVQARGTVRKITLAVPKQVNLTPEKLVQKLAEVKSTLGNVFAARTPGVFFGRPFGLPLKDNRRVGSPFGEIRKTGSQEIRHLGVDFEAPMGASVYAINDGVVRKSYTDQVYGESVIVDHGEGIFSLYLHLTDRLVREGETVRRGRIIGTVGSTGLSSAPHLHLSIKIGDVSVDPLRFVTTLSQALNP